MEYKVVSGYNPEKLNEVVNKHLKDGWELKGSHTVVTTSSREIYRGQSTDYSLQYAQTLTRPIRK